METKVTEPARHFLSAFFAAVPAWYLGWYLGDFASHIGPTHNVEPGTIVVRGLVCAAPGAVLALFLPRYWYVPWLIYSYFFYCGYTIGEAMIILVAVLIAPLTGQQMGRPPEHTHPELIWLFIISLWFAGVVSMLRVHFSRAKENALMGGR